MRQMSVASTRRSALRSRLHLAGTASAAAESADFVLVPHRPRLLDLAAIQGSVAIAQESKKPTAFVLNAAPVRSPPITEAREAWVNAKIVVPSAVDQRVVHA